MYNRENPHATLCIPGSTKICTNLEDTMKSGLTKKIVALILALSLCLSLCACGSKLSGTYKDSLGFSSITFSGNKIEYTTCASSDIKTGTYTLEDGVLKLTYDDGESEIFEYDEEADTFSYSKFIVFSKVGE